jgi:hypothetical protein
VSLITAGGWVRADAFPGDPTGTRCEFCRGLIDVQGGWVSVLAHAFVCNRCLQDPDDEGAGQRAAERLAARGARAREAWPL